MEAEQIVIQPMLTEKTNFLREKQQYVFLVNKRSNKVLIKDVLEKRYNVHIRKVHILNIKPKSKRTRLQFNMQISGYKKAIVSLAEGSRPFEFYEGV